MAERLDFFRRIVPFVRARMRVRRVFPPPNLGRARLRQIVDRREPLRQPPGSPAGGRDARAFRKITGQKPGLVAIRLIRKCSATTPAQGRLLFPINCLENRTVEDGPDGPLASQSASRPAQR